MTIQKRVQERAIETFGTNIGSSRAPPIGFGLTVLKSNTAEEPGVAKNQGAFCLAQDQVVMFFRAEIWRFDSQLSCHAKMNSDPVPAAELEKHLFAPRERPQKSATG